MDATQELWWRVTAVFDPDGGGSDFAYTVGLADRGHPELHLWARPSVGDDPGHDWQFSPDDCTIVLNDVARRLIDGKLRVGDSWEREYDEGLVTVRFSLHDPVDADDLDAWGARGAPVLPIRWELRRPPVGPPAPLTSEAQTRAAAEYAEALSLVEEGELPAGWALPDQPHWEPEQRFGPRTPLVLALAARVWQASPASLDVLLDRALLTRRHAPIGYAAAVARAVARGPGRSGALEEIETAVRAALDGRPGQPDLRALEKRFVAGLTRSQARRAWCTAHDTLIHVVATALRVEAVADLVPEGVLTLGQGAVRTALQDGEQAPDPRWLCSGAVAAAVSHVLAATPPVDLVEATAAWRQESMREEAWPLQVRLWHSAMYAPAVWEVLDQGAVAHLAVGLQARGVPLVAVQEWANALSVLLSDRAGANPAVVDLFLECSSDVPGLERLLDEPLVAIERK